MLKSEKVTRRFGFKVAVDAVDLEIRAGHVYAMLGPNGSGKTTWMKMAAKLKIALTMARDAKVYLLDEPFNGIDLLARDEIRACILREARPGKALVLSSHLVEEMEAIADRAVFIKQGKLVEERDLEEMRTAEGVSMADRYRAIFGHAKEDRA